MTRTIKTPDVRGVPTRTRGEWDAFIRRREDLDAERKRLGRDAESIGKEVAAMDDELVALVEAETTDKLRVLNLRNFVLSILWPEPSAMAVAFAIVREYIAEKGKEARDRIAAQLPRRKRLEITWRSDPANETAA